ncbi:lethal(2)neighbour of tid protein [Euwallacea similis]|uniref:lethal(2)neighbour of tid protein n=1 Tax=Euwallacea similis TaxID=1736056 RepID=UPI00344D8CEE
MAPPRIRTTSIKSPQTRQSSYAKYFNLLKKFLVNPHHLGPVCLLLFLAEAVCNVVVIQNVRYTEIDWVAYMQEVEGFLNGTLDYQYLKGDTGPLVYPAGFVYIFSALYYITNHGKNIYLAQYIFLVLYLIQTVLIHRIYRITAKVPPYALILTSITSLRIHSIFVLRLFNDPIAVLLFYISLNLIVSNKWRLGSFFYSLAVSVKMNILLYSPCLLVAYLTNLSYTETLINLSICGAMQLVLALPFLYANPVSYLRGSFDFGRVFDHKWTVNYRFLPKHIFEHKYFHIGLLVLHVLLLVVFLPLLRRYLSSYAKLSIVTNAFKSQVEEEKQRKGKRSLIKDKTHLETIGNQRRSNSKDSKDSQESFYEEKVKLQSRMSKIAQLFILPFFITNLIGVACARSIHYQFYSWYYHSLLYLAFCTDYSKPTKFLLLGIVEYCYKTYPSTNLSSVLLHGCHFVLIFGVYRIMRA